MTARKTLFVILGILMILAGITCFFTPVETSSVIPFIFGLAMVIDGIGRIIAWFSIREYAHFANAPSVCRRICCSADRLVDLGSGYYSDCPRISFANN